MHTEFADGVDPDVWRTTAHLRDGALMLLANEGDLTAQSSVVLDVPLVIELHSLDDHPILNVGVGDVSVQLSGAVVARVGDESLALGDYDPDRDAALVVERRSDGSVRVSTRTAEGATRLTATSTATAAPLARVQLLGVGVAITAVARDVGPTPYCAASTFRLALTDGAVEDDVEAYTGQGCALAESDAGLTVTVPGAVSAPFCGYGSTIPLATPSRARLDFTASGDEGAEPWLSLGGAPARVRHQFGHTLECFGGEVEDADLAAARSLEVTTTGGGARCVARDEDEVELASVDAAAPPGRAGLVLVGFGFAGVADRAATATLTGFAIDD